MNGRSQTPLGFGEMIRQELSQRTSVPFDKFTGEQRMFVLVRLKVLRRVALRVWPNGEREVAIDTLPKSLQNIPYDRRRRRCEQLPVKVAMGEKKIGRVRCCLQETFNRHLAISPVFVRRSGCGTTCKLGLDNASKIIDAGQIIQTDFGRKSSALGSGDNEPLGFEMAQRFSHGNQAESEPLGDCLRQHSGSRGYRAVQQFLTKPLRHSVRRTRAKINNLMRAGHLRGSFPNIEPTSPRLIVIMLGIGAL